MNVHVSVDSQGNTGNPSTLEVSYPHIVERLVTVWNNPAETEAYLNSVLVDDRTDRMGFSEEIFSELMYLSDLNWKRTHFDDQGVQITADNFSFSGRR